MTAAEDADVALPVFAESERKLKAWLMALWRLNPVLRAVHGTPAQPAPRRVRFDGGYVRVPAALGELSGDAETMFRAALAHVGAHLTFSGDRRPIGKLKPVQIALISLIEDARVEALAGAEYPGLRRLWTRFHVAEPEGPKAAEMLMARLSRALIDPDYRDDDPWVEKGKAMFFDRRSDWGDTAMSREIGGLLGNDLGQMRAQFNARTYVVEPAYRDDNSGLWDWDQEPPEDAEDSDLAIEAFRMREAEPSDELQRQRPDEGSAAPVKARERAVDEDAGVPVARYQEWDYRLGRGRADWTTIVEFEPRRAATVSLDRLLSEYTDVESRLEKLIRSARVSRPRRLRGRAEGERLDIDACIRATIDRRVGITPDPRVYEISEMRDRDLAVLVLLDISESTKDFVKDTTTTVLAMERAATALLAKAMSGLGDPFAIHAFCSNGRSEVRYYRVKDFDQPYTTASVERLSGLRGGFSTRIGAALRHARHEIAARQSYRRLILVVTDGEPADIDAEDPRYLVEDARRAVQELAHEGIDVFCVGLEGGGDSSLPRIFGRRNAVQVDRVATLPAKLTALYLGLTS